jgi:hypothetical protein
MADIAVDLEIACIDADGFQTGNDGRPKEDTVA